MKDEDRRRYRRRSDGMVFRITLQARSPTGPVELESVDALQTHRHTVYTTNDKLREIFEFFEVPLNDFQI